MARAPTTADVFNAIAEPRRREIVHLLAGRDGRPVSELVREMKLPQPAVSKHLGVLRAVGLVSVEKLGQQRIYRLNPKELKPVHDWVKLFERFWASQVDRIKERAERLARERKAE
ncbi:MAG: ArsR/SmtB family transcription factor [Phycisphaerae bacterium]|nr:metalloregulator ArsR/SmtB family transcription factor [Tepidisphaeraceae bacterium]